MAQPYVFAIRGNHEQMLIDLYADGTPDLKLIEALSNINYNGMRWLGEITEKKRQEIVNAISELPIAMQIESDRGTIGLVHADVPSWMNWEVFLGKLEGGDKRIIEFALGLSESSRDRIEEGRTDGVAGVGRVFVGHTVQVCGLRRFGNLYAIDTGRCFAEAGKMQGRSLDDG